MPIFNFETAREFRDGIDRDNPLPTDLQTQRYAQMGYQQQYDAFFSTFYDLFVGEEGIYKKVKASQNGEDIHRTGELVALGLILGNDRNRTVITPSGLEVATEEVKKFEDIYFDLFAALSHYKPIFNNAKSIDKLDGVGVLAPRRNGKVHTIFLCGYLSTFMAAYHSGSLRSIEIPKEEVSSYFTDMKEFKGLDEGILRFLKSEHPYKLANLLEILETGKFGELDITPTIRLATENAVADTVLHSKSSGYVLTVLHWIQDAHVREKLENMAFRDL